MASVTFYNFSKKKNSTATPTGGTSHTVALKDGTSLYKPTFELSGNFPAYTYASWQGLFFYVTNITSIANGIYDIECELDPMGSAADDIKSSTFFIERSASTYNQWFVDNEVSVEQRVVAAQYSPSTALNLFDGVGCYILRVTNGSSNSVTGIATYICTANQLYQILDFMFDDGNFNDVLSDTVVKSIFNPFQYIVSLKWCALSYTTLSSGLSTEHVKFGWWDSGISAAVADYNGARYTFTLDMPNAYFGDFRDYDPRFSRYKILYPGAGLFELPSINMDIAMQTQLYFDILTGVGTWYLFYSTTNAVIARFTGTVSCDLQISQISTDLLNAVGSTAAAIGMAMSGNPVGAAMSAVNAVGTILQPNPSINGNHGSMFELASIDSIVIYSERYGSQSSNIPTLACGRPLFEFKTISTLSGFCKCANASIDTCLPQEYKDQINSMLNSGFFID